MKYIGYLTAYLMISILNVLLSSKSISCKYGFINISILANSDLFLGLIDIKLKISYCWTITNSKV
jgi:hypothetical protein